MKTSIVISAMLVFSALAEADGVIEINQACVATGCFAGDSPGFPVQITAPGSYRLTSNLDTGGEPDIAIDAESDRVTLDLGGFSVVGPQTCSYDTSTSDVVCDITNTFFHRLVILEGAHITLQNGTVKGAFSAGVELRSPGPYLVESIHVTQNGSPLFSSRGLGVTGLSTPALIRNSTASVNAGQGFEGVPDLVRFDGNLAFRNGGRGIISGICSNNTSVQNGLNYQSCTDLGGNTP